MNKTISRVDTVVYGGSGSLTSDRRGGAASGAAAGGEHSRARMRRAKPQQPGCRSPPREAQVRSMSPSNRHIFGGVVSADMASGERRGARVGGLAAAEKKGRPAG